MPDRGLTDEKIKQELRSLEGSYNEADWQELEGFINTLEPPSAFNSGKTILIAIACILLGTGLYFAIPYAKRLQESDVNSMEPDSIHTDTGTTDPLVRPDTITPAVVNVPTPVVPVIDSAAIKAKEDSIRLASEPPPAETVKKETTEQPRPKKKKKTEAPKKEDSKPPVQNESDEDDFLKKDAPIIAVPEHQNEPQPQPKEVPQLRLE